MQARPYGGLRGLTGDVIASHRRRPQPLSHGALRRDSSPFRGAEGWAEVCGVYASVYHDADTSVSLPPVRGGVLDAPWSRDCRGGVVADGRRGRLHPRHPRRARWRPPPNVCDFAGTARAPLARRVGPTSSVIRRKGRRGRRPLRWVRDMRCCVKGNGRPTSSFIQRRAGVEARPYGGCVACKKDRSSDRSFFCGWRAQFRPALTSLKRLSMRAVASSLRATKASPRARVSLSG